MEHNFDAALKGLNECEWIESDREDGYSLGKSGFDCDDASDFLTSHYVTIQFALKFTKAALSGEVSDGMRDVGGQFDGDGSKFIVMAKQLAKEVGNW